MDILKLKSIVRDNGLPETVLYYILGLTLGIDVRILKLSKQHIQAIFRLKLVQLKEGKFIPNFDLSETDIKEPDTDIESFRKLFRGIKTGSMGDATSVREKMDRWRIANPDYSFETIIKQTENFIRTKKDNNESIYIPQADYFIYKIVGKEERSMLSAIIDDETITTDTHYTSL